MGPSEGNVSCAIIYFEVSVAYLSQSSKIIISCFISVHQAKSQISFLQRFVLSRFHNRIIDRQIYPYTSRLAQPKQQNRFRICLLEALKRDETRENIWELQKLMIILPPAGAIRWLWPCGIRKCLHTCIKLGKDLAGISFPNAKQTSVFHFHRCSIQG